MAISKNIYPPLLKDDLPAFLRNQSCKIYFSLSIYNTLDQIKNVQITLINQKSNRSALKYEDYPSGIKIGQIQVDESMSDDYKYYTTINTTDLENGIFGLNEIYKIQLRFTSKQATPLPIVDGQPSTGKQIATWLFENRDYFSEWSKVCLIKGIDQPHISLQPDWTENTKKEFSFSPNEIVGRLYYDENSEEKEHLYSYIIKAYKKETNDLKYNTDIIFTNVNQPNQIYCPLEYDFQKDIDYRLEIEYTTNNLYKDVANFQFTIVESIIDPLNVSLQVTPDEGNGRILIHIKPNNDEPYLDVGKIVIRRSSSLSNFTLWTDMQYKEPVDDYSQFNYFWNDMTIESGIWYKYRIQKVDENGNRSQYIETPQPIMCVFEDMYLTQGNIQLRIQFNPTVGQFKYNVTESQQVTIGGKFPFIRRNGNNYYRTFSIGGLISSFSDFNGWQDPYNEDDKSTNNFTSRRQLYGKNQYLYDDYNKQHEITPYKDFIYERMFREKVYDFLYANNIKLFRSTTEGNILIKLTNISFQPNTQLGRMLYSFTATAVEIDDPTLKNYIKYNLISDPVDIVTIVKYSSFITFNVEDGHLILTEDGLYKAATEDDYLLELEQQEDETKYSN